jgi:hypothetical protein
MRNKVRAAAAALGVLACAAAPASSEEGMWTFDNFPVDRIRAEMGWAPDQAWLDRVMAGTARLPGCSASNVSGQGLVLTNHHCVIACITALSTAEANYIDAGFMARTGEQERRCPNLSIQLLTGVADVTQQIDAVASGAAPEAFAAVRDAEMARIERGCTSRARRCEVVTLYEGGRYALYTYRRYDDVRLVFAPEHRMAAFGGEEDNFNFPRYCIDIALLRLYERGAPAVTANHLAMRFDPVAADEIVLTAGNPGPTSRLRTSAELAFERDVDLPWKIASLAALRDRLIAYAAQGPDQARVASATLQTVENDVSGLSGRRRALADATGFARVTAREQDLQARVRRNRASQREVGDAWGEIARAHEVYRGMFHRYQYLEAIPAQRSLLFAWARDIVRGAAEREKPSAERMPRYADARLAAVAQSLRADWPVTPSFEELHLAFWLSRMRENLTAGDPTVRRILGSESPEALAARLSQSRLADPAYRRELWEGGAAAVAASNDPMIVFVRGWDDDARAVRSEFIAEVEGPVARAQERIARARFRAFGETRYPDATFSPRLSYGRVRGWTEPGDRAIVPFTHVEGLYRRATGAPSFVLSQPWIDARERLDPDTVFNLTTTTDVTGGNSGSPLLDREGRVVGVVFDGNIHSLGGDYFYDGELNRSVSVSSAIIRAALADVYGMQTLLAELEGG